MMGYLRRNYYGVLIDCAVACCGVMWVAGTFTEWAKVVLYVAFAIVDVYQLEWVGDREGRLGQQERFEVWEWCVRATQDWRVWVEAQAVNGGEDLEGAGPDTRTEQVPVPNPETPESETTPEPIITEAISTPLNILYTHTEA